MNLPHRDITIPGLPLTTIDLLVAEMALPRVE
jgi:hypothetical protein